MEKKKGMRSRGGQVNNQGMCEEMVVVISNRRGLSGSGRLDLSQSRPEVCGSRPGPLFCELVCLTWVLPAAGKRTHNYFNLTISSQACVCNLLCSWELLI